jgi:hypothetical protein
MYEYTLVCICVVFIMSKLGFWMSQIGIWLSYLCFGLNAYVRFMESVCPILNLWDTILGRHLPYPRF